MKKIGKRTRMNFEANRQLHAIFQDKGITTCELHLSPNCNNPPYLSYCHRQKRREYQTIEGLSDFNEVVLSCINCHTKFEFLPQEEKNEIIKNIRSSQKLS